MGGSSKFSPVRIRQVVFGTSEDVQRCILGDPVDLPGKGEGIITDIVWSVADGPMGRYDTVQVSVDGKLRCVVPFHMCFAVYYEDAE